MSAALDTPRSSVFRTLSRALVWGPFSLLLIVGLWSSASGYLRLKDGLENQINDDVAALSEVYFDAGANGVVRAIEQRAALTEVARAEARYGLFTADGTRLAGEIDWTAATTLPLTDAARLGQDGTDWLAQRTVFRGQETLVVARDRAPLRRSLLSDLSRFALALVILLIGSLVLVRATTQRLRARIDAMNATLRDVGEGYADRRLPTTGDDEITQLSLQTNATIARLDRMIGLRKRVTDQIAHEMRSPLTILDADLTRLPPSPEITRARADIAASIERLDGLLDISSLDAQRGDRRGFAPLDLVALVQSIAELFDAVAEDRGQRIVVEAPPRLMITGEAAQLGRLLSNLVDNALKYGDANSVVSITVTHADDGATALRVINAGPTIGDAAAAELFTPFFRGPTGADLRGHGLGLALARAIAERHDGQLDLERQPGRTAFRLRLPPSLLV